MGNKGVVANCLHPVKKPMEIMMKVLAVVCSLALFSSSCATMFHDTNHRVVATSSIKSAKLYHNHRFIGKGTASTFIEAHGSDVVSGKHQGAKPTNSLFVRIYDGDGFL